MDLNSLIRTDLVLMCNPLGNELWENKRKPHIVVAILALNADDNELIECWEKVKENKFAAAEKKRSKEIAAQKRREELRLEDEQRRRDFDLEMKRLKDEIHRLKSANASSQSPSAGDKVEFKRSDRLQPVNTEEEAGLSSGKFERTCEKTTRAARQRTIVKPRSLRDREGVLILARSNDRQKLTGVDKAKCVAGPRANLKGH